MRTLEIVLRSHGTPVGVLRWRGDESDIGDVTAVEYPDAALAAWIEDLLEHNTWEHPITMHGGLHPEKPRHYLECALQVLERAGKRAPGFSFEAPELLAHGDVR